MPNFLEITDARDESKALINVEQITHVKLGVPDAMAKAHRADGGAFIYTTALRSGTTGGSFMSIILQSMETYEEVKSLIAQAE